MTIPLVGAGGEPVDFQRTIHSHGMVRLAPNRVVDEPLSLRIPIRLHDGRLLAVSIDAGLPGTVRVRTSGGTRGAAIGAEVLAIVRHILALDDDYSSFYARAANDPALSWVTHGAGRFVRSATAFEDVIKTICTTNCAWSATIRMTNALVRDLGERVTPASDERLFPTARAMAEAPESWYRDVARAGYRGAYMRAVATSVSTGEIDLDALAKAPRSDDELERTLLELPGVGPYAAAHIMMLMGRFWRPVLDSATRPKYARLAGRKPRSDATIIRRFAPYKRFAGLAFWCYVTSDWLDDESAD